jgi:hypothetical protein
MSELLVFDPALCCSTGVCGPEVDPNLVRFAADLEWLRAKGIKVIRYNLAQEPTAFSGNALVRQTLQAEGTECLPLILRGDEIVSRGRYPARDELARWGGASAPVGILTEAVVELVGLGAAPRRGSSSGCC